MKIRILQDLKLNGMVLSRYTGRNPSLGLLDIRLPVV
jgi:hypothetical protein